MWNRIKRWWDAEGAMVGLQGMSDRMLADMGLEREGLREKVMGRIDQEATVSGAAPVTPAALSAPCRC